MFRSMINSKAEYLIPSNQQFEHQYNLIIL
jgi:hypothetical protein